MAGAKSCTASAGHSLASAIRPRRMRQQTAKPDQREPEIGRVRAASQGDQARMGRYGEAEPPLDRAIALYEAGRRRRHGSDGRRTGLFWRLTIGIYAIYRRSREGTITI